MGLNFYQASVPVFSKFLSNLATLLRHAEHYSQQKKLAENLLLQQRLFPDMFPLLRQVQIAADFAKSVSARLAGVDVPAYDDTEQSFADLYQRLEKTQQFLAGLSEADFANAAQQQIVLRPGTDKEKRFNDAADYLLNYGLPQFYFHVSMSYAILRHNGVEIGKKDYMG